jgi:hypothetical protein
LILYTEGLEKINELIDKDMDAYKIFALLTQNMNKNNVIYMDGNYVAKNMGIDLKKFDRSMTILKRYDFIRDYGKALMINPEVVSISSDQIGLKMAYQQRHIIRQERTPI